jgi:outer membrane protein TolC
VFFKMVRESRRFAYASLLCAASCLLMTANAQTLPNEMPEQPEQDTKVSMALLRASLSKTTVKALDLSQVLQIALEQNPNIQRAAKVTKQMKAKYLTSLAEFLPDVGVAYSFSHYDGAIQKVAVAGSREIDFKSASPQLFFRFNLLQGGAQFFKAQSARKALQAQHLNETYLVQQTLRETALRFYNLKQSLADLAAARSQVAETEANLALNQERFKAGEGNQLDVLQAQTQLSEAQTQLTEMTANSHSAALRLNEVLSLPAFVEALPADDQADTLTLAPLNADFQRYLATAVKNPHLLDLEQQIHSIESLFKGAVVGAVLPEATIQTRRGQVGNEADGSLGFKDTAGSIGFTFRNMGLSSTFKAKDLKAQLAALREELTSERNRIRREVSEAYTFAKASQTQILNAQQQRIMAEHTRQTAFDLLKTGKGRNTDLIQAQISLNRARLLVNDATFGYNRSQVSLVSAMGLGSVSALTTGIQTEISTNVHE